jgi:NO-binding membrane sensor protein with MHYT domain
MHFVGMSAVSMRDADGNIIDVRFDIGLTILSLVLVLVFATVGFMISSHDEMFTKSKKQIFELIVMDASALSMQRARSITPRVVLWIIGTHAPQYLLYGGFCAGSGVIVMHYVGMAAMEFPGRIEWNPGVVAASCIIAFTAATAAFWILFRFLSTYPNREDLRHACAFLMAVAVCGMHYTGMGAADFIHDPSVTVHTASSMSSTQAFESGIIAACLVTFLAGVVALADLRYAVSRLGFELGRADETIMNLPVGANSACHSHIQRYLYRRKGSNCSLGILNQTAVFDPDAEESSAGSYNSTSHHSAMGGATAGAPRRNSGNSLRPSWRTNLGIDLGSSRRVYVDSGSVNSAELGEASGLDSCKSKESGTIATTSLSVATTLPEERTIYDARQEEDVNIPASADTLAEV